MSNRLQYEVTNSRTSYLSIAFPGGFSVESKRTPGLSHLSEHMVMSPVATEENYYDVSENLGMITLAVTRRDHTVVTVCGPGKHIPRTIDALFGQIGNHRRNKSEVTNQARVIQNEVWSKTGGKPYEDPWPWDVSSQNGFSLGLSHDAFLSPGLRGYVPYLDSWPDHARKFLNLENAHFGAVFGRDVDIPLLRSMLPKQKPVCSSQHQNLRPPIFRPVNDSCNRHSGRWILPIEDSALFRIDDYLAAAEAFRFADHRLTKGRHGTMRTRLGVSGILEKPNSRTFIAMWPSPPLSSRASSTEYLHLVRRNLTEEDIRRGYKAVSNTANTEKKNGVKRSQYLATNVGHCNLGPPITKQSFLSQRMNRDAAAILPVQIGACTCQNIAP